MPTGASFVGIFKKSEAVRILDELDTECESDPVSLEEIKGTDFVVLFRSKLAENASFDCYELESICTTFQERPKDMRLPNSRLMVTQADRQRILRFGGVMQSASTSRKRLDLNDESSDSDD